MAGHSDGIDSALQRVAEIIPDQSHGLLQWQEQEEGVNGGEEQCLSLIEEEAQEKMDVTFPTPAEMRLRRE
ncbi:Ribulose bisphosphate carboxylase large chain 2 [Dissostichus eleginoides]|uniref:Ribulose bisphosphate carboxylase large chain 2 n=1 Tax=Dissostichus eleginoides TaxID=100907 RepID=A0AAD9BG50_DISEL|nr:Ribulose bisphosphate carboxylase large chain 2 [Dissostichus eleginoides]